MSHFSLMAINFKNEDELDNAMSLYDESREVPEYIAKTRQEILDLCIQRYNENQEIIQAYIDDPAAAVDKYGDLARRLYENRNDPTDIHNIKDPEVFYQRYVSGSTVDKDGNLLSTYNPNSKWDYYSVEEVTTIKAIKELYQRYREEFDKQQAPRYSRMWDVIVEGQKPEPDMFFMLWGAPNREYLLSTHKTKEAFLEFKKNSYAPSYAVLTTTSGWYAPGNVGWFATSSAGPQDEESFAANYYKMFVEPYDDDTPVYLIDCHI